ncbi:MAG: TonB-dependent receptor, partial [Myxococcales bacterium]|nr:TonB-dependent receptor [Myxococcales bacterium]
LRQVRLDDAGSAINRDCLVPRPGGRFTFGRLIDSRGTLVGISNGRGGAGNLTVTGRLPKTWSGLSWRAQTSYQRLGALDSPEYVLDNTAREDLGYSGAVGYRAGPFEVDLSGRGYESTYGLFTEIRDTNLEDFLEAARSLRPRAVELYRFDYDFDRPFVRVVHRQAKLNLRSKLSKDWSAEGFYAFQDNDRREFDSVRGPLEDSAQGSFRLQTHLVDLHVEGDIGPFRLEPGVSFNAQINDYEGEPFLADYERLAFGAYAIGRFATGAWDFEAGARVDVEHYDALLPGRNQTLPDIARDLDYASFLFTVGASRELSPEWTLKALVASATRNPAPNELFADGPSVGVASLQVGDPDLEVETTYNAQISVAHRSARMSLEVLAYGHWIPNYIFLAPDIREDGTIVTRDSAKGPLPVFAFRQVDAAYVGLDADLDVKLTEWLSLRTSGSIVRARDLENDRPLVYVPSDALRNRITVSDRQIGPLRSPYLWAESQVVLQQTIFSTTTDFVEPPPSYHLFHAGLGTQLFVGGAPVSIDVEVRNITNERYREYLSRLRYYADEPGFSGFIRLGVPFEATFQQ